VKVDRLLFYEHFRDADRSSEDEDTVMEGDADCADYGREEDVAMESDTE
jgi:hypothetical protein